MRQYIINHHIYVYICAKLTKIDRVYAHIMIRNGRHKPPSWFELEYHEHCKSLPS